MPTPWPDIDLSRPDRDVGAMLSGDEVEQLREAINWARGNRGLRFKDIALGCDAPEHTVRNFAYRKSARPDNAFLGKLLKYFMGTGGLPPADIVAGSGNHQPPARDERLGRLARYELIRMELPITTGDLQRVFDRYSGYYLCFRRSYRPAKMSVSWLHILPLNPNVDVEREGLPLPRFTLFIKYADQLDPRLTRSHIIVGYVFSRNGRIFLIGHHDGELKSFALNEPSARQFTYLQGLCLLTSADDKQPFSARVVCQYLGVDVSRDPWEDKIGVFTAEEFESLFDNAEIVVRAIGGDEVLTSNNPE